MPGTPPSVGVFGCWSQRPRAAADWQPELSAPDVAERKAALHKVYDQDASQLLDEPPGTEQDDIPIHDCDDGRCDSDDMQVENPDMDMDSSDSVDINIRISNQVTDQWVLPSATATPADALADLPAELTAVYIQSKKKIGPNPMFSVTYLLSERVVAKFGPRVHEAEAFMLEYLGRLPDVISRRVPRVLRYFREPHTGWCCILMERIGGGDVMMLEEFLSSDTCAGQKRERLVEELAAFMKQLRIHTYKLIGSLSGFDLADGTPAVCGVRDAFFDGRRGPESESEPEFKAEAKLQQSYRGPFSSETDFVRELAECVELRGARDDETACVVHLLQRTLACHRPINYYYHHHRLRKEEQKCDSDSDSDSDSDIVCTSCKPRPFVLTHGNLEPSNVLVGVADGRLVGVVDWDEAGFYPDYWEYVKAAFWNADFFRGCLMRDVLAPYDADAELSVLLHAREYHLVRLWALFGACMTSVPSNG